MAEEKTMRLSQVARKLNVGTTTIANYLVEQGFQVENKPNTKVTLEQYNVLAEAFAGAAMDKEEAAELVIGQTYDQEPEVAIAKREAPAEGALEQTQAAEVATVSQEQPIAPEPPTPAEQLPVNKEEAKGKEEPSQAAQESAVIQEPKPTAAPQAPEKVSFTDQEKLKGLTVLGKIELAETDSKKFKQVASSDVRQERKKRPRKRIVKKTGFIDKADSRILKQERVSPSEKDIQEQIKSTLAKLGAGGKGASSRARYRREKRSAMAEAREGELLQAQQAAKTLRVTEFISTNDLASLMGVSINEVLAACMNLGMVVSINQRLDAEAITIIADEFGYQVEFTNVEEQILEEEEQDDPQDLVERAPIVTIMGHVDHGKTSLLDYIRNTQITKTEAGGITQHIGAYDVVTKSGKRIAFLDTPGHEAFTAMRARGAKLTDLAIIVVAADDGVRPQTQEAINHAQLAGVPIVIAINKIDKPQANPEKVKEDLANINILVEDWGGKYQSQAVSAKTGEGINELLEKALFEAELLELRANPHKKAGGTVIEASLDQGRGYIATVMVQAGTLHIGDIVLAGAYYGKVRAMFDHQGKTLKEAGPSTPVQILGLNGAPQAGDALKVMNTDKEAREIATQRQQILREQGLRTRTHITLDEIGRRLAIGNFKELNIILKGDVDGSVEALSDSLLKLSTEEIKVNILHKGVGGIAESDILLAAASDAIVIGFQVRPSTNARKLAEKEGIEIRLYSIIYDAINNVRDAMQGMLAPTVEEVITGNAIVKEIFKISKVGTVAGCYVTDGYLKKANPIRLIRDGIVTYTGSIKQLKRFKEEMQQVKTGFECGMSIDNFDDIKVDDVIEGFEEREVERKL